MSKERLGSQLAVVAAGGALGALARYGAQVAWPTPAAGFPWGTLLVNVVGCLLIGMLMVLVNEVLMAPRLVRPFLGVGLLGGFTTFSAYAEDVRALLSPAPLTAVGYLLGTVLAALVAVVAGVWLARLATGGRRV